VKSGIVRGSLGRKGVEFAFGGKAVKSGIVRGSLGRKGVMPLMPLETGTMFGTASIRIHPEPRDNTLQILQMNMMTLTPMALVSLRDMMIAVT
jgi:hypothetical protein